MQRPFAKKTPYVRTQCALCLSNDPLRQSHIVPEFFYKPVYGPMHRYFVVSTDEREPNELEQKGLKERMLCAKCEGRFSKYEAYVRSVFYAPSRIVKPLFGGQAAVQEVDYALFRCFMLSMIWRMGESTLPMFQQVNLGPHAEIIRLALLTDNPLLETQYPFFLTEILMGGKFREDYMLGPQRIRSESQAGYRFVISGRLFTILISGVPPPPDMLPVLLTKAGELYTIILEMDQIPFFGSALRNASLAMRKRDALRGPNLG